MIRVSVQKKQYATWSAEEIQGAKRASYVGFLHREPFVIDAYRLGFAVGVREDYTFQNSLRNVDVPVEILDNNFRNPDLDRYICRFEQHEPKVGILGDAYSREEARQYSRAVEGSGKCPLETEPDDRVFTVDGRRADDTDLEDAIVVEYEDGLTRTYRTESERARIEYRAGLTGDVVC